MIVGRSTKGSTPVTLAADTKFVARTQFIEASYLPKISVYLDGKGTGLAAQVARGIVYDASNDRLVCQGDEVRVAKGQNAGWVDFTFTNLPGGCLIPTPGYYDLGIHAGGVSNTIRVYA